MLTPSPSVRILGSRVHIVDMPRVVAQIEEWIAAPAGHCSRITVTGFHGLWEAHKHPDFQAILNSTELWVPDGIAPVWVAKRKGFPQAVRTPGAEIMKAFFERANEKGYSSYFYGDTDATLAALKTNLESKYPNHRVAGTFSPPFRPVTPQEDAQIIKMINDAKPDVLWVGLGLPKQDRWLHAHVDQLHVPVAMGVGAAFGFLSGKVKRVPDWIGNHGLEWLWRFIQEPKKLWRRDLLDGPRFVTHVLLEMSGLRKYD
jgi:N-acetylglucosaminyldiphosphoundecaprenol N-acetyl-beta-D-mannosaminyltransferase